DLSNLARCGHGRCGRTGAGQAPRRAPASPRACPSLRRARASVPDPALFGRSLKGAVG
ncbi:MAG: hypothetical protein AVDCRST_MAG90-1596, partial [uncultured Microvirga sp.]